MSHKPERVFNALIHLFHEIVREAVAMNVSSKTASRYFSLRILLPAALALALFVLSLYQFVIPQFEDIILGRKREMIRELTTSAWHVLERYHTEQRDGRMSEAEAQAAAVAQVGHLRYGEEGKDYFWITDERPFMVVHPFRDDLNGTDLSDFTDSHGKRLFVEMVAAVRDDGEGFVDYTWQWKDDSTRVVPKLSYVRQFEPWGWIIGTGIYLEDVRDQIETLEGDVVSISLWITVTISLLLAFIVMQNLRAERRRQQAEHELREAKEKYEALVEASTEGLLMLTEGAEPYMNASLLALAGYSEVGDAAPDWTGLFPDLSSEDLHAQADGDGETQIETRLQRRDGSGIDVLLSVSTVQVLGRTGRVVIIRDIAAHKALADELDETREKFLSLTKQLPLAVFRTDASGGLPVLECNAATAMLFGRGSVTEMLGVDFAEFFEERKDFDAFAAELLRTGMMSQRIERLRRSDGQALALTLSVALVRDEDGTPRYCDILAEDRSDERDDEERKRRLLSDMQAPLLFLAQPVGALMREVPICGTRYPLSGILRLMARADSDAVLLRDDAGAMIGIVGRDEIRNALVRRERAEDLLAHEIMRAPLLRLPESASVHEALTLLDAMQTDLLAVHAPTGEVRGVVAIADIHRSALHSYHGFLRQLHQAGSAAEIGHERRQLVHAVATLIDSGAGMRHITHTLTAINDAAVRRALGLALEALGAPPCAFTFLVLGSEGRREQTLATDQDNAILYDDVEGADAEFAASWFLQLGEHVCRSLNEAGYPYCPGGIMAMNPKWCRPLADWKRYFTDWITTSDPRDLLDISIFFDFRCIHGDASLGARLREHVFDTASGYHSFFAYLAQNALRNKPPTWQFKPAESMDVKAAMIPVVDLARVYSLRHRVSATGTTERLSQLHDRGVFSAAGFRDITQAYDLLLALRFREQARAIAANRTPGNVIATPSLSDIDLAALRRAFAQVETFQSKLSVDFRGTM
ncbi:MAG: cache domain-containing protein [Bacteroidetes bacterium]|nr:cache domain-containing protein [Bacteroidota bacterium]